MNLKSLLLFFIMLLFSISSFAQKRETLLLQSYWKFSKGEHSGAFGETFDDSQWEEVRIPHDWAIAGPFLPEAEGKTGKLPWKGVGWYRKHIHLGEKYKNKKVYLLFDGVMAFPEIFINGKEAGKWDYGYNSFFLDITEHIRPGTDNLIAVRVDTRKHDSRWYPGAGIYRKVRLISVDPLHVDIWGTQITTPIIKPQYADVRIRASVKNETDRDSHVVLRHYIRDNDNLEVAAITTEADISSGKTGIVEANFSLSNPRLWDIDNPHVYKVITEVWEEDSLRDLYTSSFGIREMKFTADDGFFLNNRRVQIKGVNLHHDLGPLGAAFHERALERQLEIMKQMGCNAIRTSHNVPAPELLKLCDEMGLLVYNEIFDKYDAKADITDTTDFDAFARRNIKNFVLRDRNHPSIFIWSAGNEIRDVQWNKDNGFLRLHTMINYFRKYDPTRPVTMACDQVESAKLRHFDYYDVHSYNYNRRYWLARQLEPDKSVIVSESGSTVSTRGFYELPLPDSKTNFTRSMQVSSYDLNAPSWAEIPDDAFKWQQEEEYIAGEFVWTGFDYLGEPTPYSSGRLIDKFGMGMKDESRSSYFGIVDLCGIPKDRYYLYKSYWNSQETTVHILPHWNWSDSNLNNLPVFVYTDGDSAELFLNDRSLGWRKKLPTSDESVERFRLMWQDVSYEPGELKAVAYKNGLVTGISSVKTAGEPYRLKLTPDRTGLNADGLDLSYILIEAVDKEGNICPLAGNMVNIELRGPGRIAGVGNGNPRSFNPFQSDSVPLFHGKAMLIAGSDFQTGELQIEVSAENLKPGRLSIQIK